MKKQMVSIGLSLCLVLPSFAGVISYPALPQISDKGKDYLKRIIDRHSGLTPRPESCPLQSKKHVDILTKIKNIQALFRDNCLDADQNKIDEILAGATDIQAEIDKVAKQVNETDPNETTTTISETTNDALVKGQEIANIIGNINSIYKSRQCRTLAKNGSFLKQTSDMISDFAKIGMLVPNNSALIIAGGGLALSSILLILDSIFRNRFNFDKTEDRQSFIKLNCAFYDIRREIEKSGFLDVQTSQHKKDFEYSKKLLKYVEDKIKSITETYDERLKAIEKNKADYIAEKMGPLQALGEHIGKMLPILEDQAVNSEGPANTVKLHVIAQLTDLAPKFVELLDRYLEAELSKIPVMDQLLKQEIAKLDHVGNAEAYMQLLQMAPGEFNNGYRANLIFHLSRIKSDIDESKGAQEKSWDEETRINGQTMAEYLKALEKERDEKMKVARDYKGKMDIVLTRLGRINGEQVYSSRDDGSENIVNILSDYDKIAEQIYGKFGHEFLKYTTRRADEVNKDFKKKFDKFAEDHLRMERPGDYDYIFYEIKHPSELSKLEVQFACQDAKPYRRIWRYGNSLVEQGHDFVATNVDLFHSDIPRVFLGRSGGRRGIHNLLSKFEKIQMHQKSALFAKRYMARQHVPHQTREKYFKKKWLGNVMIKVNQNKRYASLLQNLLEKYDCGKALQMD